MAVNQVQADNGRITLQGDYVVHHGEDVTFSLEGDRIPEFMKNSHKGDMFITTLRLIFVNKGNKGYKTFSMNFQFIRNFEVKQPIFGSNHLKGYIKAEPNGGWEGNANFKIDFPKGGAIEFAEEFQKAVKKSIQYRNNGMAPPPPMQPMYPMGGPPMMMQGGAPMMQPQPMYYPPPQQGYYQYQPGAPPPQGVQPLYTAPAGQPPPAYSNDVPPAGVNPKAQEAYMSGNTAYVPSEAPPPYNPQFDKKGQ